MRRELERHGEAQLRAAKEKEALTKEKAGLAVQLAAAERENRGLLEEVAGLRWVQAVGGARPRAGLVWRCPELRSRRRLGRCREGCQDTAASANRRGPRLQGGRLGRLAQGPRLHKEGWRGWGCCAGRPGPVGWAAAAAECWTPRAGLGEGLPVLSSELPPG